MRALRPLRSVPALLFAGLLLGAGLGEGRAALRTQTFSDNNKFFPNPGIGPRAYAYLFRYPDPVTLEINRAISHLDSFPGASILCLIPSWAQIEVQEGVYKWDWIDYGFQKARERKFEIDFNMLLVNPDIPTMVPQWLIDKGTKGKWVQGSTWRDGGWRPADHKIWVPLYDDTLFLRHLDRFAAAFAARYGDRPELTRNEIGTLGTWGEGHSYLSGGDDITLKMQKAHMDIWRKHLPKQRQIINDDYGEGALSYGRSLGFGMAEWSANINGAYNTTNPNAEKFWRTAPIIIELQPEGGYKNLTNFLNIVEAYHASTVSINDGRPIVDMGDSVTRENFLKAQKRMGYRILMQKAVLADSVRPGGTLDCRLTWKNLGVAPPYMPTFAAFSFKNEAGQVTGPIVDTSFNFSSLLGKGKEAAMPEDTREWNHRLVLPAGVTTGKHTLWVSLGGKDGKPLITLPLDGEDAGKRYPLGALAVTPAAPVGLAMERPGPPAGRKGGKPSLARVRSTGPSAKPLTELNRSLRKKALGRGNR